VNFEQKYGGASNILTISHVVQVLAMAPCSAYVMKRKPHLHYGTVTMDLNNEDRVV